MFVALPIFWSCDKKVGSILGKGYLVREKQGYTYATYYFS